MPSVGVGVVDDEVDHRAGRLEMTSCVADRDAELLLDGGEEFVECPTHRRAHGRDERCVIGRPMWRRASSARSNAALQSTELPLATPDVSILPST